jgi:hypothetical protein
LLIAPAVAGEAAARDIDTGAYPLTYTSPMSKAEYLGGRFLAALVLNAVILLAVQIGSLLAAYGPGANPEIIGPFRPAAYLAAYGFIALTNALIATTFQFAAALWSGRPLASYVGSLGLFFLSYPVTFALYFAGLGKRALLVDPIGILAIMNEMMSECGGDRRPQPRGERGARGSQDGPGRHRPPGHRLRSRRDRHRHPGQRRRLALGAAADREPGQVGRGGRRVAP